MKTMSGFIALMCLFALVADFQGILAHIQQDPMADGKVEPLIWEQLKGGVPVPIFVKFPGTTEVDMSGFTGPESQRGQYVYEWRNKQLQELSMDVTAFLDAKGVQYRTMYIEPQVYIFEASEELIRELAARSDVYRIMGERSFRI